ncbi:MAG TPA: allantoate amidohydrolase [Acidobacteriaceae bacterium]|jgi:allantoate deiminase|nr:allantoate amidohydrolase [Acidobacteriaceae bacterium]
MTEGSPQSTSRAAKIIDRCRELACITDVPGGTTRLFLSPATREAHTKLLGWMQQAQLETRIDDIGNVRGIRRSAIAGAPTLLLFSHIDTVPNAGPFDGLLGVILSLAAIEELNDQHTILPFNIELIALSEEEGIRFTFPFLSSLALTGQLAPAHLTRTDANSITVAEALRNVGLNPDRVPTSCALLPNTFAALEVHIEQGPVLDEANESIAVVRGIIGQSRLCFAFEGQANHAGTTPMPLRHDALAAAAEWIVAVERCAATHSPLVATVGRLEVLPGGINIVPGRVNATLDLRHPDDRVRREAVVILQAAAQQAAASRGVRATSSLESEQATFPMNAVLTTQLQQAAHRAGPGARALFSGAGHDAMILAPHVPTAMLFVRSPHGLSHHPDETVREADVEAALATTLEFIRTLTL